MSRTFAYCRVSATDKTTEAQVQEIAAAGFHVQPERVVSEAVSGSLAMKERKGFAGLLARFEPGDVLIVTKLDRLGRNVMDVRATVRQLQAAGVRVHCLALGNMDLTGPAARATMQFISAVAEFERDLLVERTCSGIKRAKAEGKKFGRPSALHLDQKAEVLSRLAEGVPIAQLARQFNTTRQTIMRIRASQSAAT